MIHDISLRRARERRQLLSEVPEAVNLHCVNLIPRFYDVTEGSITLDGVDIRNVSQHELREKLGYVPQKGILFSGDIASNIMFGNPEGGEEEMAEAARSLRLQNLSTRNRRGTKARSRRADLMSQADKSRDLLLPAQ